MATRVEQLIEQIKSLSPDEQQRLRETLSHVSPPAVALDRTSAEEEFQRRLLDAGLIKQIRRPVRDQESFLNYQPIAVRGKPLSQTIIEERR